LRKGHLFFRDLHFTALVKNLVRVAGDVQVALAVGMANVQHTLHPSLAGGKHGGDGIAHMHEIAQRIARRQTQVTTTAGMTNDAPEPTLMPHALTSLVVQLGKAQADESLSALRQSPSQDAFCTGLGGTVATRE